MAMTCCGLSYSLLSFRRFPQDRIPFLFLLLVSDFRAHRDDEEFSTIQQIASS